MRALLSDIRFAFRGFARAPGFVVAAVFTLALGIGANAAMFSVVDALMLRPLPFREPERLVAVSGNAPAIFDGVRRSVRAFSEVAAYGIQGFSLADDVADAERLDGAAVSATLFPMLGVTPAVGRSFAEEENGSGAGPVVMLSHGLWQRRYGGDRRVVGTTISIDGVSHAVIGVMPDGFRYPAAETQLWTPMRIDPAKPGAYWIGDYQIVARLRPIVDAAVARGELRALGAVLRTQNPLWDPGPAFMQDAEVVPLQRALTAEVRPTLLVLVGVVAVVLLVACANVALLLLARANAREREFGIRTALGGGRSRLVRQLLTESLTLAALGAVAGLATAWAGVRLLGAFLPPEVPRTSAIAIDWRVATFTLVASLVTGVAFGLVPALRAGRSALSATLGDGGARGSSGVAHQRLSSVLVSAQVALAVVLVIGAQLMVRSLMQLMRVDPGFRAEQVVAARVSPPERSYADAGRQRAFHARLLQEVAAIPGVAGVATVMDLPLAETNYGMAMRVEGKFEDLKRPLPMVAHAQAVTPGYLRVMGIPLLQGRDMMESDGEQGDDVVLVSASLARELWPGEDPVGKRIGPPYPSPWWTVVGVVGDVRHDSLGGAAATALYRPFRQMPSARMTLVVRTTRDAGSLGAAIRMAVDGIDPAVPVSAVRGLEGVVSASVARQRFTMGLTAAFAGLAALLGASGIHGLLSYLVSQRRREIGVRLALGATPSLVRRDVVWRGTRLALAGATAGLVAAFGASGALAGLLYGVSAHDPLTFATVPVLFVMIAVVASWVPARRAMRGDPAQVLREG